MALPIAGLNVRRPLASLKRFVAEQVSEFCTTMRLVAMNSCRSYCLIRYLSAAIGSLPIWTCASSVESVQCLNSYWREEGGKKRISGQGRACSKGGGAPT